MDTDYVHAAEQLNSEQRKLFDAVMEFLATPHSERDQLRVFRTEADAGTGKTFTGNTLANALRAAGCRVVCSAYTAKAATNYRGGATCHRVFCLKVTRANQVPEATLARGGATKAGRPGARLCSAELIVIDEITMMRAGELDAIVKELRALGFIGALLLLGNNAQPACVIEYSTTSDVLKHHVTSSQTYHASCTRHFRLTSNVRMAHDLDFFEACKQIGYAELEPVDGEYAPSGAHRVRLDAHMFNAVPYNSVDGDATQSGIREFAHPGMFEDYPRYELSMGGATNAIICPARAMERAHNSFFLDLPGACGPSACSLVTSRNTVLPGSTPPRATTFTELALCREAPRGARVLGTRRDGAQGGTQRRLRARPHHRRPRRRARRERQAVLRAAPRP